MTEDDTYLIKSREVTEEHRPYGTVRLFSENIEVKNFNIQRIEIKPGKVYILKAEDNILGKVNEKTRLF